VEDILGGDLGRRRAAKDVLASFETMFKIKRLMFEVSIDCTAI